MITEIINDKEETTKLNIVLRLTPEGDLLDTKAKRLEYWKNRTSYYEQHIQRLNDEKNQLEIDKEEENANVFKLKYQSERLAAEIEILKMKKQELHGMNTQLETSGELISSTITALSQKHSRLTIKYNSLTEKHDALTAKCTGFSPAVGAMTPGSQRRHLSRFSF